MIDPDADFAIERGDVHVGRYDDGVQIHDGHGGACIWLDEDGLRWLQAVALPTMLAEMAKVPSDAPATTAAPANESEPIPGQLAIE